MTRLHHLLPEPTPTHFSQLLQVLSDIREVTLGIYKNGGLIRGRNTMRLRRWNGGKKGRRLEMQWLGEAIFERGSKKINSIDIEAFCGIENLQPDSYLSECCTCA